MVEHSTADREVPSSNLGAPLPEHFAGMEKFEKKKNLWKENIVALPGNRTRVARMGILHDTTTPAVLVSTAVETREKLKGQIFQSKRSCRGQMVWGCSSVVEHSTAD